MADKKLVPFEALHMKRTNVQKAIELTNWYDAMPQFAGEAAGDRFHENMAELAEEFLPEDFDEKVGDEVFFNRFEVIDGKLKVVIMPDNGADEEQYLDVIEIDD